MTGPVIQRGKRGIAFLTISVLALPPEKADKTFPKLGITVKYRASARTSSSRAVIYVWRVIKDCVSSRHVEIVQN